MDDAMYQRLLPVFVAEVEQQLDAIGEVILALAKDSHAEAPRNRLNRAAHTIRGNAASLGLRQMVIDARHLEQLATSATAGFTPSTLARLHEARSELRLRLAEVATDGHPMMVVS